MSREAIPTFFFAVVVVRKGNRFLLVHERKFDQTWYLPAGRVEPGESLDEAALRETLEETGVPIELEGVLRIEHSTMPKYARMRVIYVARPASEVAPKQVPDKESLGAAWVSLAELDKLRLRGPDVRDVLGAVERGAPVYPLSIISPEGAPFRIDDED